VALEKNEKSKLISEFGQSAQDTGSTEVQIALLTHRIDDLNKNHCKTNAKDFSARRGLLKLVCNRKRLLQYLMKTDPKKYKELIEKLGLRK
jgi:small subunit ribosomal protein S15